MCLLGLALLGPAGWGSEPQWQEVRSAHFIVNSDANPRKAQLVAEAFENLREVFHQGFPNLKVDTPNPLVIFAMDGEASFSAFLPWYWKVDGGTHPVGVFFSHGDQDYAVVRADLGLYGDFQNHDVYHEYTHSVFRLNFRQLPLWLDEGLAEYFGDTVFGRSEVAIGNTNRWRLGFMSSDDFQWLPLDTILLTNLQSTSYTEALPAQHFYAESWLLVRYLLLDPEAQRQQLMQKYLQAWLRTGDSLEAAKISLGDLGALQTRLRSYMGQKVHGYQRMKFVTLDLDKDLRTRPLSLAEGLAAQGRLLVDCGRPEEALPLLQKAAQLAPGLSSVHTSLGTLALAQRDPERSRAEFQAAMGLDPADFTPAFRLGRELMQQSVPADTNRAVTCLETAIHLDGKSAPAHDALAKAYLRVPDQRPKAIAAEKRACELDPLELRYLADLGGIFLSLNEIPKAKMVGELLRRSVYTPQDKNMLAEYLARVAKAEQQASAVKPGSELPPPS
jgi:tetratricopeptide (TPR) repeat protein